MTDATATWVFYTIAGDAGDSGRYPNAFRANPAAGKTPSAPLTLAALKAAWPLAGTGTYHFRAKVAAAAPRGSAYLDLVHDDDVVPQYEGRVVLRALRLESMKVGMRAPNFQLAAKAGNSAAPAAPAATAKAAGTATPVPSRTATPTTAAAAPAPAAATAAAAASPAASPVVLASSTAAVVAAPAAAVVVAPTVTAPPPPPLPVVTAPLENVDADLADKSAAVQAAIMARRQKEKEEAAAALQQAVSADNALAEKERMRDELKKKLGEKLDAWAKDATGNYKHLPTLLATMHEVLWPGANWTPVSLAQLLQPKDIRKVFHKACGLVHPDKNMQAEFEQQFIAETVFAALNEAQKRQT